MPTAGCSCNIRKSVMMSLVMSNVYHASICSLLTKSPTEIQLFEN